MLFADEYTINGITSGTCLLKVVIRESHIDTNATTKFIRERLSSLDTYMKSVNSDVEKFNQHVKNQLDSLHARGETTHDLLSNLFKGYAAASDKTFQAYISKKEDEYDEGKDIDPVRLMNLALTKYKTLTEAGKWNAPTEEEEKIIALEAQLKKLAAQKKPNKTDDKKGNKGKQGNKSKQQKGKQGNFDKPAWMLEKPKDGEPKKKEVKGKTYWWCTKHNFWARHPPEKCKGKGIQESDQNKGQEKKDNKPNDSKALKISKALATIAEEDSDEE
jgi:hypothetical protein